MKKVRNFLYFGCDKSVSVSGNADRKLAHIRLCVWYYNENVAEKNFEQNFERLRFIRLRAVPTILYISDTSLVNKLGLSKIQVSLMTFLTCIIWLKNRQDRIGMYWYLMSSFCIWFYKLHTLDLLKNFISIYCIVCLSFTANVKVSLPYIETRIAITVFNLSFVSLFTFVPVLHDLFHI